MYYIGGKKRQSGQIVDAVSLLHADFRTYVEPFCGALWSACAVMTKFPGRVYLLNDINPHLVCFWEKAYEGWNPPAEIDEETYRWYNKHRPLNDPMTGYVGFAWSFGGKFFGGLARHIAGSGPLIGSYKSTKAKIDTIRMEKVVFSCLDYRRVKVPRNAMVYLDPPYEGRCPQQKKYGGIDYDTYRIYANQLAAKAVVIATAFNNISRWKVLHDYGDTVVRHLNGKPADGTREVLLQVVAL